MWFDDYDDAKQYSDETGEPLWDTKSTPNRYFVGHMSITMEEEWTDEDWEQLQ